MSNYVKVTHPVRGLVPFKLYPFQQKIVTEIEQNRFNILRKFRQAGCTTIASAYSLWLAVFKRDQSIIILSKGDTEATEVLDRIKVMYEELPAFLQPGISEDNKHTLKLKNRSVIKSRPLENFISNTSVVFLQQSSGEKVADLYGSARPLRPLQV